MENALIQSIDIINESVNEAEINTTVALTEAYVKAYHILESVDETTDISAFNVFQEGLFGDEDESIVKKVLLFIPRLIVGIIRLVFGIVFGIIRVVLVVVFLILFGIPILIFGGTAAISGLADRFTEAATEASDIKLGFNPKFIETFVDEFTDFTKMFVDNINDANGRGVSGSAVFGTALLEMLNKNGSAFNKFMTSLRQQLGQFDKEAYRETTLTKSEAKTMLQNIKDKSNVLQGNIKVIEKYNKKGGQMEFGNAENGKKFAEFSELLTGWTKKFSEFSKRLKAIEKEADKAAKKNNVNQEEALGKAAKSLGLDSKFASDLKKAPALQS